jgi:hypothetical protein
MNSQDTLGFALEAFTREHEYCGELDTGLEDDRVWMTCTCGAVIVSRSMTDRLGCLLSTRVGWCSSGG